MSWIHSIPLWFLPLCNAIKWPCYQKDVNQINLNHTHYQYSRNLFEFCWMWIFLWIKFSWYSYIIWNNLSWHNWIWLFIPLIWRDYLPLFWRDSVTHMQGRTSFCTGLISRKLCWFLTYVFNCLYFMQCLTSFCSIDHLLCLTQFLMLFHVI